MKLESSDLQIGTNVVNKAFGQHIQAEMENVFPWHPSCFLFSLTDVVFLWMINLNNAKAQK